MSEANNADLFDVADVDELEEVTDRLCNLCHGSGEGLYDGSICFYCGGKGLERAE
jgi:DnaJ-class molecular chaperone